MGKYLDIAGLCGKSGKSPVPLPDMTPTETDPAPAFTEDRERFLVDYYCSRTQAERLVMHRRGQELRRRHPGWGGDACDLEAMEEHFAQYPAEPPFVEAHDGIAWRDTAQTGGADR